MKKKKKTGEILSLWEFHTSLPFLSAVTFRWFKAFIRASNRSPLVFFPSAAPPPSSSFHIHASHKAEHQPMLHITSALGVCPMPGKHNKIKGFT